MEGPQPGARQVSVKLSRLSGWLDGFAERHGPLDVESSTEYVQLTAADGDRAWLQVPFPPFVVEGGNVLTSLTLHAIRERRIGVLLVRRGGYAAGVFSGGTLVSSKVGSGYVQGTTKAGGWSQQRYARRRANQARSAFAEAAEAAVRILLPQIDTLQAIVLGGDRAACEATLADPRLARVAELARTSAMPLLAVPDPRLRVLRETPDQFLVCRVSLIP